MPTIASNTSGARLRISPTLKYSRTDADVDDTDVDSSHLCYGDAIGDAIGGLNASGGGAAVAAAAAAHSAAAAASIPVGILSSSSGAARGRDAGPSPE